jgi:hypothetical protein
MPVPDTGAGRDIMRGWAILSSALLGLGAPALAQAASVEVKGVYANLWIIPEDRADVSVDVRTPDSRLPAPSVTRSGDAVIVDGGLRTLTNCSGIHLGRGVRLPGLGYFPAGSAVNITVRMPRNVRVTTSGAIVGDVKPTQAFDLHADGCSRWRIADVAGKLTVHQSGAADIHGASAGEADFDLSGITNVDLASARALNVDMSGMGKVRLDAISGPVDASLSGMGSVKIAGGRAGPVKADVSGMGSFSLRGTAASLDAAVSGIGGVHVDRVEGEVRKNVSGIGHVSVGG